MWFRMAKFTSISALLFVLLAALLLNGEKSASPQKPELDPTTGLVMAKDWELVRAHCLACHSMKTITQSSKDRANWAKTMQKMQQFEGLYPLGEVESQILDYLAENYPVSDRPHNPKIRRPIY